MKPWPPSSWMPRLVARWAASTTSSHAWVAQNAASGSSPSIAAAASRTASWAPWTRAAAWARSNALPWWWATGLPNTTRSVV